MLPLLCRSARLPYSLEFASFSPFQLSASLLLSMSIRGLKPICSLTAHFIFPALWITCLCLLEFPYSMSTSLCNDSQRGGHLSPYRLSGSFLRRVIISVTLGFSCELILLPDQQSCRTSNIYAPQPISPSNPVFHQVKPSPLIWSL